MAQWLGGLMAGLPTWLTAVAVALIFIVAAAAIFIWDGAWYGALPTTRRKDGKK